MNWTELTPLSATNLNSLETRIADADASVVAGKQNVYNAILAYGQTPTSQAFADLVTAISAMPIRGVVVASAQDVSGTTIRLRPPIGYYNGTASALVTATDPDFIAAYILNGKNLFGLTGTARAIVTAGTTTTIGSALAFNHRTNTAAEKIKEVRINAHGIVRTSFALQDDGATAANGKIYINGVARGVLRTKTGIGTTFYTEDFAVNFGDLVQLYTWQDGASNGYSAGNLTILIAETFTDILLNG